MDGDTKNNRVVDIDTVRQLLKDGHICKQGEMLTKHEQKFERLHEKLSDTQKATDTIIQAQKISENKIIDKLNEIQTNNEVHKERSSNIQAQIMDRLGELKDEIKDIKKDLIINMQAVVVHDTKIGNIETTLRDLKTKVDDDNIDLNDSLDKLMIQLGNMQAIVNADMIKDMQQIKTEMSNSKLIKLKWSSYLKNAMGLFILISTILSIVVYAESVGKIISKILGTDTEKNVPLNTTTEKNDKNEKKK